MHTSLMRTLYLLSLGGVVPGLILFFISFNGSPSTMVGNTLVGNLLIFGIALFLLMAGVILLLIVEVNALIKTARLGRWDWFIGLLLFSAIALPIYLFTKPETHPTTLPS